MKTVNINFRVKSLNSRNPGKSYPLYSHVTTRNVYQFGFVSKVGTDSQQVFNWQWVSEPICAKATAETLRGDLFLFFWTFIIVFEAIQSGMECCQSGFKVKDQYFSNVETELESLMKPSQQNLVYICNKNRTTFEFFSKSTTKPAKCFAIQRRIQKPVIHPRWSFLRKQLKAFIAKGSKQNFASNIERVNSLRSPLKSIEKTIGYFEENFILRVYGQEQSVIGPTQALQSFKKNQFMEFLHVLHGIRYFGLKMSKMDSKFG